MGQLKKKITVKQKPLTPTEEKRVAIAKDALAQLKAEKIRAAAGNGFVDLSFEGADKLENLANACEVFTGKTSSELELKPYLDKIIDPSCKVCAKGALFLSSIRKFNNFSIEDAKDDGLDDAASYKIQQIFGKANADKIEEYFEENDRYVEEKEMKWSEQYPNDNERLIAILKNVIANRGIFKPEF